MRFAMAILAGLAVGLLYSWLLSPSATARGAAPQDLRADYQADYVLMVAEVYAREANIARAIERLHYLGNEPGQSYVQQAILTAGQTGLDRQDLELLGNLNQALADWIPQPEGAQP